MLEESIEFDRERVSLDLPQNNSNLGKKCYHIMNKKLCSAGSDNCELKLEK